MVINWVIWAAFILEFVLVFSLTNQRTAYVRKAWLYLAVILFAFPPLADLISYGPLAGTIRILRVVFLATILVQSAIALHTPFRRFFFDLLAVALHPWMFAFRPLLKRRGLGLVTVAFCLLAVAAGFLHSHFENHSISEGLWWALVTLTTVGYGDVASVTAAGRITGAVLMVSGVGVLAFITASIAAYFVEGDYKAELHEEVRSINKRLDRIEELLAARQSSNSDND